MDGDGVMTGLEVSECYRCSELCAARSRIVNGVGPADASLLVVGEAPGAEEDRQGEPFVGRSGRLLDGALADCGLDRDSIRITNTVRCRPPDNRDPRAAERKRCREWLETEIDRVDPRVILAVGKVPASHLLGRDVGVTAEAGNVERVPALGANARDVVISVHPAAVLYDRSNEERLTDAIETAAELAGMSPEDDQQRLSDY